MGALIRAGPSPQRRRPPSQAPGSTRMWPRGQQRMHVAEWSACHEAMWAAGRACGQQRVHAAMRPARAPARHLCRAQPLRFLLAATRTYTRLQQYD